MNFAKHRVNENQMLSELLDYCRKIINHIRSEHKSLSNLSCCISTRSNGVEITHGISLNHEDIVMVIRYDERNDFYYYLERLTIGERKIENRIIIKDEKDFYAYFKHMIEKTFGLKLTKVGVNI